MLSARPAADIVLQADAMGMDFSKAVADGSLILLEYSDDVPGRHSESSITLQPDSFLQLADLIAEQAVARLVLVEDFIAAVREERPPFVSALQAAHAVDVVLAIYRSQNDGIWVDLPNRIAHEQRSAPGLDRT